jgi:elongation factor G
MAKAKTEDIRNVAFCGHGSTGKTTLVDTLLVKSGAVSGTPSVDAGSSICDFDPEEKNHKYTVEAKLVHFDHKGKRFNALDTPGYPDFIGQAIGALYGVDLAVIVIDAHSGIQVNTRRMFDEAGKVGLGRMIVINKLDLENINFEELVGEIRELWGTRCVLVNVPLGSGGGFKGVASTLHPPATAAGALVDPAEIHEALIESVVEVDEALMERYFEGQPPTDDELPGLLTQAVAAGSLIPIVCVSGKTGVGLPELMDALAMCALPPTALRRTATKNGDESEVAASAEGPLVARVFKTRIDPFVQKLSFIRIVSGAIKKDDTVHATGARKGVKLGPLLEVQANETKAIDHAGPGDIVAIAKMEDLHTGATLGDSQLPPMKFPTPMVGLAVNPKSRGDETKLSGALHKLVEEDPTFRIDRDAQTKEMVITGMSELHLQLVREKLARRDHVEVDTKEPKIPFRETIQAKAEGSYRHKKQSGGRGQFGEVHIHMLPLPRGTKIEDFANKAHFPSMKEYHYDESNNFLWINSIVGGTIPSNFLPAVEKGFKDRMTRGVIAGYQVQDVAVNVHFGKYHDVDSSEAAFKTAGSMCFRNVFQQARPALLEPIVKMDITVPEASVGDVYSDMSSRGGRVSGSEAAGGGMQTVHVEVPLRSVTTYNRTLSSMTGGQGSYTMDFSHYEVMPPNVQQEIIAKAKLEEEEEG